ncbi:MAG: SH3 domain-containing protein [Hyphomonadaceae bacterium]|nr:SH3 domain-containing protein [Hyphomonadaceae bacterium]
MTDFTQEQDSPASGGQAVGRAGARRKRGLPLIWLLGMTLLVLGLAGAALWGISKLEAGNDTRVETQATTFKTKADYGIRDEAGAGSGVVANLKAGSTVSARTDLLIDGEQWYEVTTIDGTVGFMPASMLERFAGVAGEPKVTGGLRSVEVSALVHLRQAPSLSAAIVGTADSGTRLTADGVVEAEGERWLRVPLTPDLTAFVVERYTQVGNDRQTEREFDQNTGDVGAAGTVRELANLMSSPLPEARVLKALRAGESVRVIGQTRSDQWWYVVLLEDASQGFVLRDSVSVSALANRYVYSDGTAAPGPDVRRADADAMRKARAAGRAREDGEGSARSRSRDTSPDSGAPQGIPVPGMARATDPGGSDSGVADPGSDQQPAPTGPAPASTPATGDTGVIPEQ